jgi:tRNA nucleotidyltransferase (CCA-adding enzyme)
MGRDLIKLGVEPGPEMGLILRKLYERQLDNAFETRAEGIAAARALLGKKESP